MADYTAQAIINTLIHKSYPKDPIVGEEDADHLRSNKGKELLTRILELANLELGFDSTEQQVTFWLINFLSLF